MIRVFCIIACVFALDAFRSAIAADLTGTWLIQDGTAKVRIVTCGEAVCGNVIWLSQPNDSVTGQPQTDKLNANPQLRNRPMLGVPIVLGMRWLSEDNKWAGRLYNPDDGNIYNASVELLDATRLRVQACVAIYCQSETWIRSN